MPFGSGLSAQVMAAQETTVGTAVTVTKAYEFLSESLSREATWQQSAGLRAGQAYVRTGRMVQTAFSASGDLVMEHADRGGMGLWWKHALGSAITVPVVIGATTAFEQVHTPGPKTGLALTTQIGRPQTDGTVRPFTYRGVKVVSWEFSVSDGEITQFSLTLDGWEEDVVTALAVASFPASSAVFSFKDATVFKLGGTAATASGKITITGGVAATTVFRGFTIRGETPLATDRRGLGNAGIKREQIENDRPTITGTLEGEFTSRTEIYDLVRSGASTAMEVLFDTGVAAGTGNNFAIGFKVPAAKFQSGAVNVDGPDIIGQSVDFTATDDGANAPLEVRIVSTDTTLG
jgi:hypothetical protein